MNRIKTLIVLGLVFAGVSGYGKTVGLWKVSPLLETDGMVKTLEADGWRVVVVGNTNLADGSTLAGLDALYLPGGWEAYRFAGFKVRRNLVEFVAGGKGLLDCDVNTFDRPLFSEIGFTVGYIYGSRVAPCGSSGLARTTESFSIATNISLRQVQAGAAGETFAVVGTNPAGVFGQAYGGRYALFGGSFVDLEFKDKGRREKAGQKVLLTAEENKALMEKTSQQVLTDGEDNAIQGLLTDLEKKPVPVKAAHPTVSSDGEKKTGGEGKPEQMTPAQQVMLNCLNWLASAPALGAEERKQQQSQADIDFLRREKLYDWTQIKGGIKIGKIVSLIPEIHSRLMNPLEKRQYNLSCLIASLSGESLSQCNAMIVELQQTIEKLNNNYLKVLADYEGRIRQMDISGLTEDNPFIDSAGVRRRVEAMPGKTDAEKAEMLAVVGRCESGNPLPDAPQRAAMYLHGQAIAEQIMPMRQWSELTERCDKVVAKLQAAIPTPPMAATVEERMRIDPLMMPYYTGNILPTPQKAEYRDVFLPMSKVGIVVGSDVVDPDVMIEILQDRLTRYGGSGIVMDAPGPDTTAIISLGETEWASKVKDMPAIPEKPEGYILHTANVDGRPVIILKGHDRLGLVWAIASEIQLIHWREGKTMSRAATVQDYPILQKRGLILEGGREFHANEIGQSVSRLNLQKNRMLMLVGKFNEPCYQKLTVADLSWKYLWKYPDKMPVDACIEEDIAAMGRNLTPLGITWWGGLRPHETYDSLPEKCSRKVSGDEESVEALLYYARLMEKAGGHLSIILDDCRFPLSPYDKEQHGTGRVADTWFLTRVMAQLKKEYPKARLLVCPPFYWGPYGSGWWVYGEDRVAYLARIGEEWPPEIEVFWSGASVNQEPMATKKHVDWWTGLTRRKPYLWQNGIAYRHHANRTAYPTDWHNALWYYYWDGFMDNIGWYGFNSADIPRYGITAAVSADFQWNPQAYCKDKTESAIRSSREVADKFVGQDAWTNMLKVTRPLMVFDAYIPELDEPDSAKVLAMKKAAMNYDVLDARRDEVMAAFKEVKEKYPASINAWTALGGFIGVANMIDKVKADPKLAFYRAAVQQRAEATARGEYDSAKDSFIPAVEFSGGVLKEIALDALDDTKLQPAQVFDGPIRNIKAEFTMNKDLGKNACELVIKGRQNDTAGKLTLTLNGKTFSDKPALFGRLESTTVRFPVPVGLLNATNKNVFAINLAIETKQELGVNLDDALGGGGPPLAIHYAVFRSLASGTSVQENPK